MNTKLLEGYVGYTTYYREEGLVYDPANIIMLHSGKWWKPNKKFVYPRLHKGKGRCEADPSYYSALKTVEEYFKCR